MRNLEKNGSDTLESRNLVFCFLSGQIEGLNNIPSSGGEKQLQAIFDQQRNLLVCYWNFKITSVSVPLSERAQASPVYH